MPTKRIRNQKDPTTALHCPTVFPGWPSFTWICLSICVFGSIGVSGTGVTNALNEQNVTCIAHDAKFTCDCQNVEQHLQLPHLVGHVFQVEISNCKSLNIEANVLGETMGLRKITFKNVDNLVLEKYALAFSRYASNTPLIVEFDKVNFKLIDSHAINGNVEEISFLGGSIEAIHSFGFTTIKDKALLLKMDGVRIKKIETQAFKKFAVDQMEITNCIFETNIPSKAFYELEVLSLLRINNVQFKYIHSRAFSFKVIRKLSISNNYFEGVDAEWLEAYVRESVLINENYFGETSAIAFKALSVHREYLASERLELRFFNNTLHLATQLLRPLEFNDRFMLSLKRLQYENEFPCTYVDVTQTPAQPKIVFFAEHIDGIYFSRGAAAAAVTTTTTTTTTSQAKYHSNQSFVVLSKIIEWDCQPRSYLWYIILGVVVIVLVIAVIVCVVWMRTAKKRKRKKLDIVMPEARTYKETQIIYKIENAGLLKTDL